MAELTDLGRQTTFSLGRRLRHLYVHQLGFLPEVIRDANMVYLRSSSYPRTLESLQQVYTGLYPPGKRDAAFGRPTIVTRRPDEETLMPNENYCERFIQLAKVSSKRTANRCECLPPGRNGLHSRQSESLREPFPRNGLPECPPPNMDAIPKARSRRLNAETSRDMG